MTLWMLSNVVAPRKIIIMHAAASKHSMSPQGGGTAATGNYNSDCTSGRMPFSKFTVHRNFDSPHQSNFPSPYRVPRNTELAHVVSPIGNARHLANVQNRIHGCGPPNRIFITWSPKFANVVTAQHAVPSQRRNRRIRTNGD